MRTYVAWTSRPLLCGVVVSCWHISFLISLAISGVKLIACGEECGLRGAGETGQDIAHKSDWDLNHFIVFQKVQVNKRPAQRSLYVLQNKMTPVGHIRTSLPMDLQPFKVTCLARFQPRTAPGCPFPPNCIVFFFSSHAFCYSTT